MNSEQSSELAKFVEGEEIRSLELKENGLSIFFDDLRLRLWDDGQSCCEKRYMHSDDDLNNYAGAVFMRAIVQDAPPVKDKRNDKHEIQFLHIFTSKGVLVVETHNEHNGNYEGFSLKAELTEL